MKKNRGFTLVELLVGIAIIGVVLGITLASLAASLRSSSKTTVFNQVKQSGDHVMETMVRGVRNAVDVCTAGGASPQILIYPYKISDCSLASGEIARYTCVIVGGADGRVEKFDLPTSTTTPLTTKVQVSSCTFAHSNTVPRRVTIDFTFSQSTSLPQSPEFQVSIPFHSEVTLRNF